MNGFKLRRELQEELHGRGGVMARVLAVDKQEANTFGRYDFGTWNDERVSGTGNPLKRYS
jgi:hypothetical protein